MVPVDETVKANSPRCVPAQSEGKTPNSWAWLGKTERWEDFKGSTSGSGEDYYGPTICVKQLVCGGSSTESHYVICILERWKKGESQETSCLLQRIFQPFKLPLTPCNPLCVFPLGHTSFLLTWTSSRTIFNVLLIVHTASLPGGIPSWKSPTAAYP